MNIINVLVLSLLLFWWILALHCEELLQNEIQPQQIITEKERRGSDSQYDGYDDNKHSRVIKHAPYHSSGYGATGYGGHGEHSGYPGNGGYPGGGSYSGGGGYPNGGGFSSHSAPGGYPGSLHGSSYGHDGYGPPSSSGHGISSYGGHGGYHVEHHPYEHGHGHDHGHGHGGGHVLAFKSLLVPLAGIALLGAAAALSTNPVLLQLGVVSGKRRRRDLRNSRPYKYHKKN